MNIMIDIIIYAGGYVLVSKIIDCQRDKFIKDWLYSDPNFPKISVLEPVDLKKHTTLKQPHLIE